MNLLAELKRRNVFRVAAAYAVVGWLLIQFADIVFPRLGLPDWTVTLIIAVLLLGFPLVLVLSWVYELTPEGLKRETEAPTKPSTAPATGRRLDWLILIGLVVLIAFLAADRLWFRGAVEADPATVSGIRASPEDAAPWPAKDAGPGGVALASEAGLVAVLPFRNRSVREEDAFFAEGIHDDLLTRLAKLAGLKVISRTSMMRYADSDKSVPQIAGELGAAVVLEGAVQRAGDQVRVTVQLIDGATDVHLWAETYDRALSTETIFAIQADIAQAVASAMQVVLSPEETDALQAGSTRNLQAYEAFLRGKLLSGFSGISPERSRQAIAEFGRAIALDPEFAEAWAQKARVQLQSYWLAVGPRSLRDDARESVAQARRLAPDSIETLLAEAWQFYFAELDYAAADRALRKVLAQAPDLADAWQASGFVARRDGRFDDAIVAFKRALAIDPQAVDAINSMVETLSTARGDFAAASAWLERVKTLGGESRLREIWLHEWKGDLEAAWAAVDGPIPNFVAAPARVAIATRDPERIEYALSPALWPEDQHGPGDYPEAYAMVKARALRVMGRQDEADHLLAGIKARMDQRSEPYPSRWLANAYYQPSTLPGLMGDLQGVREAEADYLANAPRDVWGSHLVTLALAEAFARAGDPERALDYLESQVETFAPHLFLQFQTNPDFDTLRDHPRYLALEARYRAWAKEQTNE